MGVGVYRYYDDGGRVYQVALPDEFATALFYEDALPGDTYLPASISPRYATYVSTSHLLYREVVVPNRDVFVAPPQAVSADGETWNLVSLYGERFMLLPGGNIQVISGPQGPRGFDGVPGANVFFYDVQTADIAINNATNWFDLTGGVSVDPGEYMAFGQAVFQTGAAAGRFDLRIASTDESNIFGGASGYMATVNQYVCLSVLARVLVQTNPMSLSLFGGSSITTGTARRFSPHTGGGDAGRLFLIRLGDA